MPPADDAVARAVRSFAAAAAGEIAHELGNRLATMRETLGLLEDLARAGRGGAAGTARAHASLDDQVGRALNLARTLGALGNALGAGAGGFDAGAAAADLLGMGERWARRQSLRVEREIAAGLPPAAGDPALFLCLLHRLLARASRLLPGGGEVRVAVAADGGRIAVRVAPAVTAGGGGAASDDEEVDRELALRLGGGLTLEGGGAATITLAARR